MDNNNKKHLLDQIEKALGQVNFGSVEIIVQDKKVTQISVRSIQKTSININEEQQEETIQVPPKTFTISGRFGRRTD